MCCSLWACTVHIFDAALQSQCINGHFEDCNALEMLGKLAITHGCLVVITVVTAVLLVVSITCPTQFKSGHSWMTTMMPDLLEA